MLMRMYLFIARVPALASARVCELLSATALALGLMLVHGTADANKPVAEKALQDKATADKAAADKSAASESPAVSSLVRTPDGRRVAPDIARIVSRGELVVSMTAADTPPFYYMENGEMAGIDVQLVKAMARELKVDVRFDRSAKTFNQVVEVVADGKADIAVSKLGRTLGRAQQVLYSDSYLGLRHGLLVNRVELARVAGDRPATAAIRDFTGRICMLAGTSWEEFGRRFFPKATLEPYKSWDECVSAVKTGKVAAAYRDEFEARAVIKRDPKLALTLRTIILTDLESSLAIAVNSRDVTLLGFVNQFIALRPEKLDVEAVLREVR